MTNGHHHRSQEAPVPPASEASDRLFLAFILINIPLALLIWTSSILATAHALAVYFVGLVAAHRGRLERVIYTCAYITGAEVAWRVLGSRASYEFGKYSVGTILLLANLRTKGWRGSARPLAFFLLLVPSVALLTMESDTIAEGVRHVEKSGARDCVSSYMSGPFVLAMAAWFFTELEIRFSELVRIFQVTIAGTIGLSTLVLGGMRLTEEISFGKGSNFNTSGGFGPNQVATALGLGALFVMLSLIIHRFTFWHRNVLIAVFTWLLAQSMLTFSRSGLYCAAAAMAGFALASVGSPRAMARLGMVLLAALPLYFFVLPALDSYTAGTLSERFQKTSLTGRDSIVKRDLDIWARNPLLGVGPGQSGWQDLESNQFIGIAAHTEYTRLLSEHGVLGFFSLLLLLTMIARNVWNAQPVTGRAVTVCLITWAIAFMCCTAFRTEAPAFVLGLSFATLVPDGPEL